MARESSSTSSGVGLGSIIAAIVSWSVNHSIWWAFWHGVFGWFYIIYYLCGGGHHG